MIACLTCSLLPLISYHLGPNYLIYSTLSTLRHLVGGYGFPILDMSKVLLWTVLWPKSSSIEPKGLSLKFPHLCHHHVYYSISCTAESKVKDSLMYFTSTAQQNNITSTIHCGSTRQLLFKCKIWMGSAVIQLVVIAHWLLGDLLKAQHMLRCHCTRHRTTQVIQKGHRGCTSQFILRKVASERVSNVKTCAK